MVDWHARMQRSQHLATALAGRGHPCVYLPPHLGLEYEKPFAIDPHTRLCSLGPNLYELHIHLPREHSVSDRAMTPGETARTLEQIRKVLETAGIQTAISIVSFPAWLDVCKDLRDSHGFPVIYDCHDYLPGFMRIAPELVGRENELLETCDRVCFSAQP